MTTEMTEAGKFSSNVATSHGPNWLEWLGHLKGVPHVTGVELGTWMGESAEFMLDNIFTGTGAHYWCVDTFEGSDEHHLAGIDCSGLERATRKRLDRFGSKAQIFKGRSDQALKGVLRDFRLDFVYVDAAHDAMNVLRDSVLAWDLIKVGGVAVFDDFQWASMPDELDRPKIAIEAFLNIYARQLEILSMGWQVAVKKIQ